MIHPRKDPMTNEEVGRFAAIRDTYTDNPDIGETATAQMAFLIDCLVRMRVAYGNLHQQAEVEREQLRAELDHLQEHLDASRRMAAVATAKLAAAKRATATDHKEPIQDGYGDPA
jgi:hypothetical protein